MNKRGKNSVPQKSLRKDVVDPATLKKLSGLRRGEILSAAEKKTEKPLKQSFASPSLIRGKSKVGFNKRAMSGNVALPSHTAHSDFMAPDMYSPIHQLENMNLPRDRVTMNAWNRIFYDTHPIVRNAINLHASYPISKINITCKVKRVQDFFLEMAEKIDLYSVVYGVASQYWLLGEVFPYAELDRRSGTWKRITILNPDYIHVKKPIVGNTSQIFLRPDATLQRIVKSTDPADMASKKRIPKHIIDYIRKGQNIPLDPLNVSHLKLLSSPYDTRGTSVIVSVYKDLMLYDKLRQSKFAQADGMINPVTLVKLGAGEEYRAQQEDINAMKMVLEEAQHNKDFKIVTHDAVSIEKISNSGATMDIAADIEHINNNLFVGLMTPRAIIEQEGSSYASSSIGLEVLRQRYDSFRNMIKKWLELKVFAPICEIQGFFEYEDGENRLVVPQVDFNHMNLYDMNDYIQNISSFVSSNQVSLETLYHSLGLSKEEEDRRLKEEMIARVIRQKEEQSLNSMRLAELRNLDADSAISEAKDSKFPGQESGDDAGMPGLGGGGDAGGLDMGGLPPMDGGGGMEMPDLGGGDDAGGGEPPM